MRSLKSLDENHLEIFKSITEVKQSPRKAILSSIESSINLSYLEYFRVIGELSGIKSVNCYSQDQKEALLHCYNSSSKPLNEMIDKIYNLQPSAYRASCQYCGIGEPETSDHYIPKELYPEYSVLPLNLIPCCPICNTLKSNKWLNKENRRQFINLYFDYINKNVKFLYAEIKYNGDDAEVNFMLLQPPNMSVELFELVKNHYVNLKLFDRYKKKANEYISEIETILNDEEVNDKSEIEYELKRDIRKFSRGRGMNYYKVAIADALLNCKEFLETDFT